jgi:hypothetical protein
MHEIKPQAPKENINGLNPEDLAMYEQPYKSARCRMSNKRLRFNFEFNK